MSDSSKTQDSLETRIIRYRVFANKLGINGPTNVIEKVHALLRLLSYREREVIKLRSGLDTGYIYSLGDISDICKVTRERVRQIEAKAIRKLQSHARRNCK